MRLSRLGPPGQERPFLLLPDGRGVDLSDVIGDIDDNFFRRGGFTQLRDLTGGDAGALDGLRVGPPVARPAQILCVGLNYVEHARESGFNPPSEPVVFSKSPHAMCGPYDDVVRPRGSAKLDWEVEIGVVIGTRARYLADAAAGLQCVGGYFVVNDVSERAFQLEHGGQWLKGKSADTFHPAGPWLVSPDEFDLGSATLWLEVNDKRQQHAPATDMIFDVGFIVWYLSQFMTLEPGDVIDTGTPPGVALGRTPPPYLQDGDVMTLGVDGLGRQRQVVVPAR